MKHEENCNLAEDPSGHPNQKMSVMLMTILGKITIHSYRNAVNNTDPSLPMARE